jgi:hypothetical protein
MFTTYAEGDNSLFDIRLAYKVFVKIPLHGGVCIPLFTFQKR